MEAFNKAAEDIKTLTKRPTNTELLNLYALYKQGLEGDNTAPKPNAEEDMQGYAKWSAWNKLKGKFTKEAAQQEYVKLVTTLLTKYPVKK